MYFMALVSTPQPAIWFFFMQCFQRRREMHERMLRFHMIKKGSLMANEYLNTSIFTTAGSIVWLMTCTLWHTLQHTSRHTLQQALMWPTTYSSDLDELRKLQVHTHSLTHTHTLSCIPVPSLPTHKHKNTLLYIQITLISDTYVHIGCVPRLNRLWVCCKFFCQGGHGDTQTCTHHAHIHLTQALSVSHTQTHTNTCTHTHTEIVSSTSWGGSFRNSAILGKR